MILLDDQGKITCPIGDTAFLHLTLDTPQPVQGVAVFAVRDKAGNEIFSVPVKMVDNTATFWLPNEYTDNFPESGTFYWGVRVVVGGELDADGNVVLDRKRDEVHSPFAFGGSLPLFEAKMVSKEL